MKREADIIIQPALHQAFSQGWAQCRVLLLSAPCGFGKTAVANRLLQGHTVCRVNALEETFLSIALPQNCDAVLVDHLQYLQEPEHQQALCTLIRTRPDLHFVLLTRGRLPGFLMPFQFAGLLCIIEAPLLLLDRAATQHFLEASGVCVTAEELTAIHRDTQGYPVALKLLCRQLQNSTYTEVVFGIAKRELFLYFDESVYRRLSPAVRELLLSLAPFEPFDAELARILSGDTRVNELIEQLLRDTTMFQYNSVDSYRFWPVFRAFLLWELEQKLPADEQRVLYSRAALYYELHDKFGQALDCYSKAGEHHKVSIMLEKNAELHPGVGHYYEMEHYYFALPKETILRSPALLCGMSMLSAMCMDFDASEQWYNALQTYSAGLKKSDTEYRAVQGRLAYLDIALPQRGSKGLLEIIGSVFRILTDKQIQLPAFSVTSTLPSIMNGGKDFCEWSKKDDALYRTMRVPVEAILGKDGIGLADCAICESKFEKGEDISARMLALMGRLGEIQAKGTPDIEFAVVGLWARMQATQGKAAAALDVLESLHTKFAETGRSRFLPNLDALRCRLALRLGDREAVEHWLTERAPKDEVRLRALWRYQYLTRVMVQITKGRCDEALLVLARLLSYCERCGRTMDGIYIRVLTAICRFRLKEDQWKAEFCTAMDACHRYGFIYPIAQYGAAVLPLLLECGWKEEESFYVKLLAATRVQTVYYPKFLECETVLAEPLSGAEMQVLRLLCHNKSNAEIGELLGIKLSTVKTHVNRIFAKLDVKRRSEAKAAAETLHLL